MIHGTVYIHDRHQLAVFHEPSGYVALAFMGFPAGWTELGASAIRSYRSRRRRRGAN